MLQKCSTYFFLNKLLKPFFVLDIKLRGSSGFNTNSRAWWAWPISASSDGQLSLPPGVLPSKVGSILKSSKNCEWNNKARLKLLSTVHSGKGVKHRDSINFTNRGYLAQKTWSVKLWLQKTLVILLAKLSESFICYHLLFCILML